MVLRDEVSRADARELKILAAKDRFREKYRQACNKLELAIVEKRNDYSLVNFLDELSVAEEVLDQELERI